MVGAGKANDFECRSNAKGNVHRQDAGDNGGFIGATLPSRQKECIPLIVINDMNRTSLPIANATASLTPEGRAVDSAVNAGCILSLCSAVLFPAPLIPDREIVVSVRQHVRLSLLPQLEGNAQKFEDFFCRPVAEVSSALACCFRVPEQPATLYPAGSRNRFLAMAI